MSYHISLGYVEGGGGGNCNVGAIVAAAAANVAYAAGVIHTAGALT